MLESIIKINQAVNGFIWGVPAMICIIGVGLLLSVRTRFIQVRKFGAAMKNTIGKIFDKTQAKDGSMSPFQAVCTALAGTVGTGNIAGVAGAIALGGPGAIFWMWCSAFLGMCTKFSEVTLAIHFREKNANGEYVGGPMYYIKNGLSKKWHFLAVLYALFGVLTVFGTGNATQVNTIVSSIHSALHNLHIIDGTVDERANLIFGIFIAAFVAMVLLGGIKRIGQVSEKLVPFMATLYVILAIGVVILHINRVPAVFAMIFKSAFTPQAATGGIIGSMFLSMKKGVSRGIFSNEAGLGTGSIAHACADTNNAVHQGMFGIFEVFMDTIVICTLTGLVILLGAPNIVYGQAAGAELTISGFTATYGGWVSIFTAVAMCCFAFSTIIGWGLYGSRCIEFLGGEKLVRPFLVAYSFVSIIGATINVSYMGWISAGGANASDLYWAGLLGTFVAIQGGMSIDTSVAFAVPIGLLGNYVHVAYMTIASLWPVKMDALAAKGNWRGIRRIQFLGGPAIVLVLRALPVFLIALYGSEFIQTMINSIPTWAMNGLAAVGKMLPALGMSMLMKFMYKKALLPFFVLGFGIAAYSGMTDLLLYALVGVCLAVILIKIGFNNDTEQEGAE